MAFCGNCGTQIADNVAFCPSCGKATGQAGSAGAAAPQPAPAANYQPPPPAAAAPAAATSAPLADNVAGMLAYITIIPAIIFLLIEPYNRNRFVRFHSFQNLFFHAGMVVLGIALAIATAVLHFIPVIGWMVAALLVPLCWLGVFCLWLLLLIKAYQGQMYKLPFIGDVAEKQAGA